MQFKHFLLVASLACGLAVVAFSPCVVDSSHASSNRSQRIGSPKIHQVIPAQPDVLQTQDLNTGLTLENIMAALVGSSSISISNVQFTGSGSALGTFTGGTGIIGFEQGIVLSTGQVADVVGPNSNDNTTTIHFRPGDADLDSLLSEFQFTHDACVLEFDFECPAVREIGFEYVFSSEEYNEFVFLDFNDVFGFFVNEKNIALLPDGVTVVSIDNVNGGNPDIPDSAAANPQYFRNNDECQFSTVPSCPVNTEMDGLTVVLIARAKINPGINHIKLAVADVSDGRWDSNVFLKGQSFICGAVNNNAPTCAINPSGPFSLEVGSNLTFNVSGTDPDDGQSIYLYPLGNLPPGAVMTPSLPRAGSRTGLSSQFSWTPTQVGVYSAGFFVTDSLGGADTSSVQITVTSPEVNNSPVCVINPPGPFTVNAGKIVTFTVNATDPDSGQTIRLANLGALPTGATMTPAVPVFGPWSGVTSQFSWTPSQIGSFLARFSASDSSGGFDSISARINVLEGVAPIVTDASPADGVFDVPWTTGVIIEFSEPVVDFCNILTSPSPCIEISSRRQGAINFIQIWDGTLIALRPETAWPDDDTITIVLSGEIRDVAGNSLDGNLDGSQQGSPVDNYVFSFFTSPGVYSGDANDDGAVDERDVLPIGVHFLRTGQPRSRNSDTWALERATPWVPWAATHADCDGNGIVDSTDICAILEFFDREIPAKRNTSAPDLDVLSVLDDDIRASLLRALLNCENGSSTARATLIEALNVQSSAQGQLPTSFTLEQNYPNPFNAGTVISWTTDISSHIELTIFDVLGRPVRKMIDESRPAGYHTAEWDGMNDDGTPLASGVYFYRLSGEGHSTTKRMVLIR